MLKLLKLINSYFDFKNRLNPMDDIVFFSESNAYKPFLFPLILSLLKNKFNVIYLTTDPQDNLLINPPLNLNTYYISDGLLITLSFIFLRAKILITTMPDLNNFYLKRSIFPVHYIYIQHSLCSIHMIYREGAFNHYDTILCAGRHHYKEIREWELLNNLPKKNLYAHGYIPLDKIIEKKNKLDKISKPRNSSKYINILLAPSWGKNGIIHLGAEQLLTYLLKEDYNITLRLHPQSIKTSKTQVKNLEKKFIKVDNFKFDKDNTTFDILYNSDILITDWSGIALEFFFAFQKPIIFLDTPKKVYNNRYKELKNIPIEIKIRNKIGFVINLNDIQNIKIAIQKVTKNKRNINEMIKLRKRYVYNLGNSVNEGTKIIKTIYKKINYN